MSQCTVKGMEAALAASQQKPGEAMPTLAAEVKAATIIKQEYSFAIFLKQREFGGSPLLIEGRLTLPTHFIHQIPHPRLSQVAHIPCWTRPIFLPHAGKKKVSLEKETF